MVLPDLQASSIISFLDARSEELTTIISAWEASDVTFELLNENAPERYSGSGEA